MSTNSGAIESGSDAVVSSEPPSNSDNGAEVAADMSDSKAGTLTTEPSSAHDGGGDIVVQDSIDNARVSGNEIEIVMDNDERGLNESNSDAVISSIPPGNSEIAAINGVNFGSDLLNSKTETKTLTMEQSSDHNKGGYIAVQDSIDDSRVFGDEKRVVMENMEKVSDENGVNNEEKEGEYKVTDLVWAKVKSYPWWPGQIFDPSASTDKAKKYSNKKGFLVGYYGDQTFAWNEASKIKPFRKNFSKMEKQSNSKAFFHAVNCALEEVSRRVEFGLACSCLSKELYDKIKSQVFVNAGIKKEASKIDGGDRFSTVSTFKPVNIVQSVQDLAKEHFDGFSRLEVLSVRTQLLAFFRWKGDYQFQAQNLLDELDNKLEDDSKLPLLEADQVVEDTKPASVSKKVSSKKRKFKACDSGDSFSKKKEKCLINVTPKGNLSVKSKSKKNIEKKATVKGMNKESGNGTDDKKLTISSPKKVFRVGDSICRIAKQISGSPAILEKESQESKNDKNSATLRKIKKDRKSVEAIQIEE